MDYKRHILSTSTVAVMQVWFVSVFLSGVCSSYAANTTNIAFTIDWPLQVASAKQDEQKLSLLHGETKVKLIELKNGKQALKIVVAVTRPSNERQRTFWNSTLAYPQYNWMSAVRVWDAEKKWLWPNLTYLLRPFGTQRIDRYGGWDPGKKIDNDFAAVLIRKYDSAGIQESSNTSTNPLISAEWYAEGMTNVEATTVVHEARSDEFSVTLCNSNQAQSGQIRVWIIYADFFGTSVPKGWPKEQEFNGGILKFFKIDWSNRPKHGCTLKIKEDIPPQGTRFDWKYWLNRMTEDSEVEATPRLSD
ncbi:MAG: hypothetical protein A2283_20820 [Lentisphaerae bacterium RIFOXYA12_FULL_48_11]|nr:MAG: hypothetical protein A2283_20820 [Lentisphaerae bacterium RIFOXYA12_FULL_48_11]